MSTTNFFNANGWRHEQDQLQSESTRRLLGWLRRLHESDGDDVEDVAARIGLGLRELTEAHTVAVFARDLPGDALRLLAISQAELTPALDEGFEDETVLMPDENFDPAAFAKARFSATHLWDSLPANAFWVAGAAAHLQVFVGEICDWVNTFALTDRAGDALSPSDIEEDTLLPSLGLPLCSHTSGGGSDVIGLALLWIFTEDGLIPANLEPLQAAVASHAADALAAALRHERLSQSYRQLAELVAKAADARQPQRSGHAESVAYFAGLIAQELGLPGSECARMEFAGLLHNVGNAGVPDAILHKQESLTSQELEVVRGAAAASADWLREVDGLESVALMVRHQNERWDGSGLPDGLAGEAIPLGARILAVALRFAAMTQARADRGPRPVVGGALDAVAGEAGTALDPQVVRAFLTALGRSL